MTRRRLSAGGVAAVVLVVTAVAVGLLFPTDVWRVSLNADGLTLAFLQPQQPAEQTGRVLFADDFDSGSTGVWNEREDDAATVRVTGGELRIRLRGMGTFDFEAPALPVDAASVRVGAAAHLVEGEAGVVVGLFCAESAGPDASHSGLAGGYLLVVYPARRTVRIGHVSGPIEQEALNAETLADRPLPAGSARGERLQLEAECDGAAAGETQVTLFVNGAQRARVTTRGTTTFDGAGVIALTEGVSRADVGFDDFVVREAVP